jgi:two-component system NtrC family sensor kinase
MSNLGHLVAGVAPEINNPVSFIYGKIVQVNQYVLDLFNLIKIYPTYSPEFGA